MLAARETREKSWQRIHRHPDATDDRTREKKGFKFPTAFTVLFFVLILVWALSFVIKPGAYDYVGMR